MLRRLGKRAHFSNSQNVTVIFFLSFLIVEGWRDSEDASLHGNRSDFSIWEDVEYFIRCLNELDVWEIIARLAPCELDFYCLICLCFLLLFYLHFIVCVMVGKYYFVSFLFNK